MPMILKICLSYIKICTHSRNHVSTFVLIFALFVDSCYLSQPNPQILTFLLILTVISHSHINIPTHPPHSSAHSYVKIRTHFHTPLCLLFLAINSIFPFTLTVLYQYSHLYLHSYMNLLTHTHTLISTFSLIFMLL